MIKAAYSVGLVAGVLAAVSPVGAVVLGAFALALGVGAFARSVNTPPRM